MYRLYPVPPVAGGLDRQVEHLAAFIYLRHCAASEAHLDIFHEFRHGHPVSREHLAAGDYRKFGTLDLLLDIEVGEAFDIADRGPDVIADVEQSVQIVSEYLYRNRGLSAREHRVDAVRDGLADLDIDSRQGA